MLEVTSVPPFVPARKRIYTRKSKILVDETLELTDDQLRDSRERYDREQARMAEENSTKKKEKAAYFLVMDASRFSSNRPVE